MKQMRYISLVLMMLLAGSVRLYADEPEAVEHVNIIEQIEATSGGNVVIEAPDDVMELLDYVAPPEKKPGKAARRANEGYRIQVFNDGTDQYTLKARVQSRASAILSRFPKYRGQVYTFANPPKWTCQVGNFQTLDEANKALSELRRAFPQYAGEFRTISTTIVPR